MKQHKIIVILGPTASGKSDVAIRLAKKLGGEVISAYSRQVYRGMNIGSGKIACDFFVPKFKSKNKKSKFSVYYSSGIPHYMIDIVSPKTDYNVAKFKKMADKIIFNILNRGKIPIICGGTGFWIKAIVDNVKFPEVKPDWKLRQELANKSALQLFKELKKIDPERAEKIDKNNKVRLIRAIEIAKALGKVPSCNPQTTTYNFLQIGIKLPKEKLYQNIEKRLDTRFKQGMIKEVKNLHKKYKVSWKRLENFGLEYKWIALYLQKKLSKKAMQEKLLQAIKNYSKKQITWFKKDKRIKWFNNYKEIEKEVKKYLSK